MDPLFFSTSNGVPPESKLATYMVTPQSPEFIPSRLSSSVSPNIYPSYTSKAINSINSATPIKSAIDSSILGGGSLYNTTPIKVSGRGLIRGDSPQSTSDSPRLTPQPSPPPLSNVSSAVLQENVNGTTYFYPTAANHTTSQTNSTAPENTYATNNVTSSTFTNPVHVYAGPASHVYDMQSKTRLSSAFFMPEEMRQELLEKNQIANLLPPEENQDLPLEVDNYHSLYPIEMVSHINKLTIPSSTYRATHNATGIKYCLRRLHGFRIPSTKCLASLENWKKLQHSNIVQLREVFTTKAFGDHSLVLVYDYHPKSETLYSKYFSSKIETNGYTDPFPGDTRPFSHKSSVQRSSVGPLLPETEIWSIIMQLTAGLRAVHQAGLACRLIDPSKIIITGKRIRYSFLGISDIITYDPSQAVAALTQRYQQEDLTALGQLILALSCRCLQSIHRDRVHSSIELISRNYSNDLRNLIVHLLTTTNRRAVTDLMPMIGARFYMQLDALQNQCDMQEEELSKEMENGRLYRLLVKLGSINERPELNLDVTWSETGDRYMLKLYRDYLFHTVTEDGRPWLDQGHIIQSLNKLDAGTFEKVQLMSRDEQSVLVVTYGELKECLEKAFSELIMASS